jgi:hypothetical protein
MVLNYVEVIVIRNLLCNVICKFLQTLDIFSFQELFSSISIPFVNAVTVGWSYWIMLWMSHSKTDSPVLVGFIFFLICKNEKKDCEYVFHCEFFFFYRLLFLLINPSNIFLKDLTTSGKTIIPLHSISNYRFFSCYFFAY